MHFRKQHRNLYNHHYHNTFINFRVLGPLAEHLSMQWSFNKVKRITLLVASHKLTVLAKWNHEECQQAGCQYLKWAGAPLRLLLFELRAITISCSYIKQPQTIIITKVRNYAQRDFLYSPQINTLQWHSFIDMCYNMRQ